MLFDTLMEKCPYLRGVIEDKITEEIGKKDVEIKQLQDDLAIANEQAKVTQDVLNTLLVKGMI
jgi:hypothetical protein